MYLFADHHTSYDSHYYKNQKNYTFTSESLIFSIRDTVPTILSHLYHQNISRILVTSGVKIYKNYIHNNYYLFSERSQGTKMGTIDGVKDLEEEEY